MSVSTVGSSWYYMYCGVSIAEISTYYLLSTHRRKSRARRVRESRKQTQPVPADILKQIETEERAAAEDGTEDTSKVSTMAAFKVLSLTMHCL